MSAVMAALRLQLDQMQQLMVRIEQRFDTLDAGLTALRAEVTESTDRIIRAMGREP
jgi:hypothetical protein